MIGNVLKILGLFVLLLLVIGFYTIHLISRMDFSFSLHAIDLAKLSLESFSKGTASIKLGLRLCIKNTLTYSIRLRRLRYQIYFEGTEVGRSSEINDQIKDVNILADRETCFVTNTDFIVNPALLKLVYKLKTREPAEVEYHISGTIWRIPFSRTFKTIVNEPTK